MMSRNHPRARGRHGRHLLVCILVSAAPTSVNSFGWLKVNTLSERLMGARPEWGGHPNNKHNQENSGPPFSRKRPSAQTSSQLRSAATTPSNRHSGSSSSSSTKQDLGQMLEFMNEPPNLLDASDLDPLAPLDADTMNLMHCIVRAADGRKAEDIVALKVHHVSTLTSVLVILSGNSRPQNQAIASAITKDVQSEFGEDMLPQGKGIPEGSAESGWMLLDYGTVMVHIMTPKSRLFYNVQGQWLQKGAQPLDIRHILLPNNADASLQGQQAEQDDKDDDPFWS